MIVNEHENVFPNDQLISLLDDSLLEIEIILPSKSLAWLKVGTPFEYAVDETGLRYPPWFRTSARMSILRARR